MGGTIELEPEVGEEVVRAWVLDDIAKEANQVAGSVKEAGLEAECVKPSELSDRIHDVVSGIERAPDVALIDLQWNTGHSSIELGQNTIAIEDRSRFGLKIAEHLRSLDQFRRCTIVIATQYVDEDIGADLEELGMAVLIPKRLISELPDRVKAQSGPRAAAGREALGGIGLKIHPRSVRGANPKILQGVAKDLALEHEISRLAGATRGNIDIAELLDFSRDARERVTMLRRIVAALRELYHGPLPDVEAMGRELELPLRSALLEGSQADLQRILWSLEDRGGGGVDVHDEIV